VRWGWHVQLFFRLAHGEEMALPIDLDGYLRMAEREPRMLAIMETIQAEARSCRSARMKELDRGARNRGKTTHPIAKR
jgi:hypothetical protein